MDITVLRPEQFRTLLLKRYLAGADVGTLANDLGKSEDWVRKKLNLEVQDIEAIEQAERDLLNPNIGVKR